MPRRIASLLQQPRTVRPTRRPLQPGKSLFSLVRHSSSLFQDFTESILFRVISTRFNFWTLENAASFIPNFTDEFCECSFVLSALLGLTLMVDRVFFTEPLAVRCRCRPTSSPSRSTFTKVTSTSPSIVYFSVLFFARVL